MATLVYPDQKNVVNLTNEQAKIILTGCRLNERVAQKELYVTYYNYAMTIALRYSSNYDNAVEMTNDAFLKIYLSLKNFEQRFDNIVPSFTAWLKRIVINACIDYLRKYQANEMMTGTNPEHIEVSNKCETPEQMLQHKEIIKCILQLSPAYKLAFNLFVIEGLTHSEIAHKLHISEGTSKSNLSKARQQLQQLLRNYNIISYG